MPCFYPLPAFYTGKYTKRGAFEVTVLPRNEVNLFRHSMRIPCGKCTHCRLKKSAEWAIRCVHESSLYVPTVDNPNGSGNCFVTLTYNDDFLPALGTLVKRDFQLFMKRLRRKFGEGIRYYYCGEYGAKHGRPHYHALLFNFNFDFDKYFWKRSSSGFDIYRSPSLEGLWSCPTSGRSYGYSSVADLSFDSAAYVSRYCMKKITGDASLTHYAIVDYETGELLGERLPEYNNMSNRYGIGKGWFDKYYQDVYSQDEVIMKGKKRIPPKYYDSQYELICPDDMGRIKDARLANLVRVSPERLKAMEKCKARQVERLVRVFS